MCPKTEKFIRIFEFAGVCGRPRTSLRVRLHGNSYLDGDKVTFSCDGNHDLFGKAELICVGQTWDSTVPECKGTFPFELIPWRKRVPH